MDMEYQVVTNGIKESSNVVDQESTIPFTKSILVDQASMELSTKAEVHMR